MSWSNISTNELEKVFENLFNPESLQGENAKIYDLSLKNSEYLGISWQQEMKRQEESVYHNFMAKYLEDIGYSFNDLI